MGYELDLSNRHALVTGGGTGIGLAIAKALAGVGAQVTITGRRVGVLEDAADGAPNLYPYPMDVADEASVSTGIEQATAARGPITIAVANAGIAEGRSVPKTDYEFWRQTMAINLDGAFLTMRACLPGMREVGWGRGIGISSIAGLKGLKGAAAYTASKHGLTGLMRGLAADYAETELTFNAICPAYVETAIVERNITSIASRAGISEAEANDIMVNTNVHKRLISPEEVAASVLWLCGPLSGSVNGTSIEIAGGQI